MVKARAALPVAIFGVIGALLLTPLVVSPGTFSQYTVSKALFARSLIEVMVALWVLLLAREPGFRPPRSYVLLALTGFVVVALAASITGTNVNRSIWSTYVRMTGVWDLFHWFMFVLVLASVVRSTNAWRGIFNGQLAVALLLSLLALGQAWGLLRIPGVLESCRVTATLGNPSFLAPVLAASVLLAAGFLAQSWLRSRSESPVDGSPGTGGTLLGWRGFWLLVMFLGTLALVYTGTRAAVLALGGGALLAPAALLIWGNRRALVPVAAVFGAVFLGLVLLFGLDTLVGLPARTGCQDQAAGARVVSLLESTTTTSVGDEALANRLIALRAGASAIAARPWLGWGPENFGTAFDRHADPEAFQHGSFIQDRAHNVLVEELTTKGVLGFLTFAALWLALLRGVIRWRRSAPEEALAYGVLGALASYLVQGLFFFDTTSILLVWSLLVGWVVWQESTVPAPVESPAAGGDESGDGPGQWQRLVEEAGRAFRLPWCRRAISFGVIVLLGASLYLWNYLPYASANAFGESTRASHSVPERLALAERSFAGFPRLANLPRRLVFLELANNWAFLSSEERQLASEFVARQARLGLEADSRDGPLLMSAIAFAQRAGRSAEARASLMPLLARLRELAPGRVETHWLLANQALQLGDYNGAITIVNDYLDRSPGTERYFVGVRQAALNGLGVPAP